MSEFRHVLATVMVGVILVHHGLCLQIPPVSLKNLTPYCFMGTYHIKYFCVHIHRLLQLQTPHTSSGAAPLFLPGILPAEGFPALPTSFSLYFPISTFGRTP